MSAHARRSICKDLGGCRWGGSRSRESGISLRALAIESVLFQKKQNIGLILKVGL